MNLLFKKGSNSNKHHRQYDLQIKSHKNSFVDQESASNSPLHSDRANINFSQTLSIIKVHRKVSIPNEKAPITPSNKNGYNKLLLSTNLPLWNIQGKDGSPMRKNNIVMSRNILNIQSNKSYKKNSQKLILNDKPKLSFKLNKHQNIESNKTSKAKLKPLDKLQHFVTDTAIADKGSRKLFK